MLTRKCDRCKDCIMTDLNEIDILTRNPSVIGSDDENKDGENKDIENENKTMEKVSCESTTEAREDLDLLPGRNMSSVRQDICLLSVQKKTDIHMSGTTTNPMKTQGDIDIYLAELQARATRQQLQMEEKILSLIHI